MILIQPLKNDEVFESVKFWLLSLTLFKARNETRET